LIFYSASLLKQQLAGRHVAPLGHIILISNQPVVALTPQCRALRGETKQKQYIMRTLRLKVKLRQGILIQGMSIYVVTFKNGTIQTGRSDTYFDLEEFQGNLYSNNII
jgi:hypothetical protein